jgi:tRNA nucleotidyltransferase (CCA-adding enzyme)
MQGILERIRPSEEEKRELEKTAEELLSRVKREAAKADPRLTVALLGSASRGTWLKNEKDLDVFVFFPLEYKREELEEAVTQIGTGVLEKPEKHYAEHPYVAGLYRDYEVEIVPCYAVESPRRLKSAVDRTPFHDAFVRKHIPGKEDEVRLLKQFLKGIRCYGAEAKVEGFSGYLCELLVLKYGSFKDVLEAAQGWGRGEVLSFDPVEDEEKLRAKFSSPLIFLDPVDKERNVASALSEKNFSLFRHAAREYLRNPREEFFFPRPRRVTKEELARLLKERGTSPLALFFPKPEVIEDILYTQGRKALRILEKVLRRGDFRIITSSFFVRHRICMLFELESLSLPAAKLHLGPRGNAYHEARFLEKYRGYKEKLTEPFLLGGRWAIYLRRRHTRADAYLREFLSLGRLEEQGIPSYMARSLEEGYELKADEDALEEEFLEDLQSFLDPRFPWEV